MDRKSVERVIRVDREELREVLRGLGADRVGFASMDRFDGAPGGHHPRDLMQEARTVVVLAQEVPRGLVAGRSCTAYTVAHEEGLRRMDGLALETARTLERRWGGRALPVPSDDPYEDWDPTSRRGAGDLSLRHAARAAGLGVLGRSGMLLLPDWGSRADLGAVVWDREVSPDPERTGSPCPPECDLCVRGCPGGAIRGDGVVEQARCRDHVGTVLLKGYEVVACWRCRALCPCSR